MIAVDIAAAPATVLPPLALLQALPAGPLARGYGRLNAARRVAPIIAGLDRLEMEAAVELLIAELGARVEDRDAEEGRVA